MKTLWNTYFKWPRATEMALLFEPRDLWVGVYWTHPAYEQPIIDIYVTIIPTLPVRFRVYYTRKHWAMGA